MQNNNFLTKSRWLVTIILLLSLGVSQMWGATYTLTFAKNSGDGTKLSTSDNASTCLSGGSDYVTGTLATATNAYYNGGSGLKLGKASSGPAGDIKMNLSTAGAIVPKRVSVYAKYYSSSAKGTVQVCTNLGSNTAQTTTGSFSEYYYSYSGSTALSYIEIKSSKYIWLEKIVVTGLTAITLNKNGGGSNGSAVYDHLAGTKTSFVAVNRDGYTCTGYWTESSGGTKILNADGSLAAANIKVSTVDYTNGSTQWVYAGGTLTLYAQWESAAACTETRAPPPRSWQAGGERPGRRQPGMQSPRLRWSQSLACCRPPGQIQHTQPQSPMLCHPAGT